MEKIKVEYVGPYDVALHCPSYIGIVKKGELIHITEKELLELGSNFKKATILKRGETNDG